MMSDICVHMCDEMCVCAMRVGDAYVHMCERVGDVCVHMCERVGDACVHMCKRDAHEMCKHDT